jgi:alpha-N-acetylglucosaminidase
MERVDWMRIVKLVLLCITTLECFILACSMIYAESSSATSAESSARGVLERLLGERAGEFILKEIPKEDGKDVYIIEASNGKVTVSGSSGVAISRGAYEYLRKACHCQVAWEGNNLPLPKILPDFPQTKIICPYKYTHYFNVCTFGYTMVWWDWKRWEKEIDWMALHGINMPLAMNGQEGIWQKVWKGYGFTDEDLAEFFSGPAFLPWHRMGNLNGHAGPLPQGWMGAQRELHKQILERERELGMTPIIPAFAGFVPPAFIKKFPNAVVIKTGGWNGFEPTYILNPKDQMFREIGKKFIEEYRKEFGTDHIYLADSFNEMRPDVASDKKQDELAAFGEAVLNSILAGDPDGIWAMQGWLFLDGAFWGEKDIAALFSKVPSEKMIILDLAGFGGETWSKYNRQYIQCMMSNYGHITSLYGGLQWIAGLAKNFDNEKCRQMLGFGIVPEGIENNTAFYELLVDTMWDKKPIDFKNWLKEYCTERYGSYSPKIEKAWNSLVETIYSIGGFPTPSYLRRPTFGARYDYPDPIKLRETVKLFLDCSDEIGKSNLYQRDLVDVVKHYLGDATFFSLQQIVAAWQAGDKSAFKKYSKEYLRLLDDIDTLIGTRPEYHFSKWINNARSWGKDTKEADFYEKNARLQLTVWGKNDLFDYARKEWSGLISNFYAPRYEEFFKMLEKTDPLKFSQEEWNKTIAQWELDWCGKTGIKHEKKSRDTVSIAKKLFEKYKNWPEEFGPASPIMGIAVGKPITVSGGTTENHGPERAVDGNPYNTDSAWHSIVGNWLCVDLEKEEKIDRVQIFNVWGENRYYQYTVEVSPDNKTWTMVADMSKVKYISTSFGFMHKFKPINARYVRVTVLFNSVNAGIHLVEVRVFGAE